MAEIRHFDPFAHVEKLNQKLEDGGSVTAEEVQRLCDLLVAFPSNEPLYARFAGYKYVEEAVLNHLTRLATDKVPDEKTRFFTWHVWEIKDFFAWEETRELDNPVELDENDPFSRLAHFMAQEYELIPHRDSMLIFRNDQTGILLFYLRSEKEASLSFGGILRSCINEVFPTLFVRKEVTKRFLEKEHRIIKNNNICTPELASLLLAKEHYLHSYGGFVAYNCNVQVALSIYAMKEPLFPDEESPLEHLSKVLFQLSKEAPMLSEDLFEQTTYVFRITPVEEKRAGDVKVIEMEANATFARLAGTIRELYAHRYYEWSAFLNEDGGFRVTDYDDMRGATRQISKKVERTVYDAILSDYFRRKRCLLYQMFFYKEYAYRVERLEVKRSRLGSPDVLLDK